MIDDNDILQQAVFGGVTRYTITLAEMKRWAKSVPRFSRWWVTDAMYWAMVRALFCTPPYRTPPYPQPRESGVIYIYTVEVRRRSQRAQ